ncbi:MAG: transketolase [Candidatus Magasanikbacteria bacterium CG11_big_fil_rev_8_21_14_0_20_39_34]|uniref:Transketolase n=1 Tax=Candidatus Magasanikbacteria bacterium CG11_big_fil_rev_8_21_14_0_20_39_34 TaxID=1974653 RepID=A0A2H0N8J6_9BACT|nr:MAG: transketolase [Candidatus Magasanikbacteria bacterium CG11_big_fil_rev_8_21_14_0_20_39_34]
MTPMPISIPQNEKKLTKEQITFLKTFATSCRYSIISMLKQSQSGHPGGSLGCADYLSLLYAFRISQTGEPLVVSNGHISPAVYAALAELGIIPKKDVIEGFRKIGYPYEGHVTRHVRGVDYGTGPLGTGVSAASGFALAQQLQSNSNTSNHAKTFAMIGDGESQEGQVYEMMNFSKKYKLNNFIVFMDYNEVQLTDSLKKIMPINPKKIFEAGGWEVIEMNGHDFQDMWSSLKQAEKIDGKPVLLLAHTIMGKGVSFMEQTGANMQSTWHGKAPNEAQANEALRELVLKSDERKLLSKFQKQVKWKPKEMEHNTFLKPKKIRNGAPRIYKKEELTDCRTAYGNALLDLAQLNQNVVALTADLADSVKTSIMEKEIPERHFDVGIAEQQLVSCSGGLSLSGFTPFCSTFGAFMSSRAKDQARVNDINQANVKMVATHCGLSVGEDGPTHQAIDDMGSFLGFFHTGVIEPADPNQCDRIIRYIASHYGNFYVRMGRHKFPVITREDGSIFYDENYEYVYGKSDVIRKGKSLTIAASGATVYEALLAIENIKKKNPKLSVELVAVSSIKEFDNTLIQSIKKTKNVLTVEDHNTHNGLSSQLSKYLHDHKISVKTFRSLGVDHYQLSGTAQALYQAAGIDSKGIQKAILTK